MNKKEAHEIMCILERLTEKVEFFQEHVKKHNYLSELQQERVRWQDKELKRLRDFRPFLLKNISLN